MSLGIQLHRYSPAECEAWVEHLEKRREKIAARERLKVEEVTIRHLSDEERKFVRNEILLCSIDFRYWCERYCFILQDAAVGGGLHRMIPWGPQIILLDHIGRMEEEQADAFERGESVKGILIALHKARQLGATMFMRAALMHRMTTGRNLLAVTASVDDDKILAIQERDQRIVTNLPWWMRPHEGYGEKGLHLYFDKLDTKLQYQTLVQKTGIAQGEQYILGHITEAASDPNEGESLENDYFPAIPQAPWVLHCMETTAQGRANWWRFFVDEVRKGSSRWHLIFIPWYAELRKYRMTPPEGWQPSKEALTHAQKVYETSREFIGTDLMLPRDNLYWWEFSRADYLRRGHLADFLANWCSTIEESFQHSTSSVFSTDILDFYRNTTTTRPPAYDLISVNS